ncbi:MAG: prepilin-type N-terminal cleavage/methylation domain-containing protein [Candidatus Ancaeobacter aquaticus]|nr:prepilin-type N-terminal cleavage/methylation domain-containing protein [Candidatus Ancaeobacter aquaticus]
MRVKKQNGFTLLETVVAFGLLTVLVVALTMIFSQGIKAFKHGFKTAQISQSARTAMDCMIRELASAYAGHGYKFKGQSNLPYRRVDFMVPLKNSGDCDLVEVSYWFAYSDPDENKIFKIWRYYHVSDKSDTSNFGNFQDGSSEVLAENVVKCSINYLYAGWWSDSWISSNILPKAVRIEIKIVDDETMKKYSGSYSELEKRAKKFVGVVKLRNAN